MRLGLALLVLGALVIGLILLGRHKAETGRGAREAGETESPEGALAPARAARIVGTVRNEKVEGVPGAGVVAEDPSGNRHSATVAADGAFAIDGLAPGRYVVSAWTPGHWRPKPVDVEVPAGGEARCDLVAHRGWSFRGVVRDRRDHAVEGIDIRPFFNAEQVAISDAKGAFDLGGFHGEFETVGVRVRDPRGRYAPWEGDAFEGVVITLEDGVAIEGEVVRRETGAPIAGARLRLREEKFFPHIVEVTSGRDGKFRIAVRPLGAMALEADAPGLAPLDLALEPGPAYVRVELGAGGTLDVLAVDPEGRPVEHAQVWPSDLILSKTISTGPDGRAALEHLAPGRRRITVSSHEFLPKVATVEVPSDGTRASVTVLLRRGGVIEGKAPQTWVEVMARDFPFRRWLTLGKDGAFRVAGLPSGTYDVISGNVQSVEVVEGETVRCDFDAATNHPWLDVRGKVGIGAPIGTGRIRARVVGADGLPFRSVLVAVVDRAGDAVVQSDGDGLGTLVPSPRPLGSAPSLDSPGLAAGVYDVLAVEPEGGFAFAKGVRVLEDKTTDVSLVIGEGGAVEVTVADALTGVLLKAKVSVARQGARGIPGMIDRLKGGMLLSNRRPAAATNSTGIAVLDGLSAGEYTGRAETADGAAAEFAFTIRDGETTRVRAEVRR